MTEHVIHHPGWAPTVRAEENGLYRAPKGLSANDRVHWRTKNASTKNVRALMVAEVERLGIPRCGHLTVELVWIVGDNRDRDDDNLAPFAKAIYDGLAASKGVSAHLVPDDTPEFITKKAPRVERRPGEKPHRFEIRITTEGEPTHG